MGPEFLRKATNFAQELSLPLITECSDFRTISNCSFLLCVSADGLGIQQTGEDAPGIVNVDFLSGSSMYRREHGGGKSQGVAKAVGVKKGNRPYVLDATAGLGRDGFVLACLGCPVTFVERTAVIAALLEDGISRAKQSDELKKIMNNVSLVKSDSRSYIAALSEDDFPDVVYLDPMFPQRTKSAKVKKEMAVFHDLVGADDDSAELLKAALRVAKDRVVVKRPKGSEFVGGVIPSHEIPGFFGRYDVYVNH